MKNPTKSLMEDLLYIADRLNWNSDVGRKQAQERMDEIHAGKYKDKSGWYVQCKAAIEKL